MAVPASSSRSAFLESLSFETVALRYLPSNVLCCNSLIVFVGCNPLLWRCQFTAIVIHSLLLLILSLLDRRFIYLCHLFHSTPHVFFIVLLFVFLVFLFLFYNYQHAKARFYNDSPQRFSYKFYPSCEFCSNHGISRQIEKGEFFFLKLAKKLRDYGCFRPEMHLGEIIFLAGSHLFTVSVIVIQMQAFFKPNTIP